MNVAIVYRGRYHVRQALDLETLAAVVRQAGHDARLVYDSDTFGVTDNVLQIPWLARRLANPAKTVARIGRCSPDVILFSVLPNTYSWARDMALRLKSRTQAPIVFLGLHPSLAPKHVMANSAADYAIEGEVEPVIVPLLDAIAEGRRVTDVGNLWYRHDGTSHFTQRAKLADLDALPLPDKDLFRPYVSHGYSYAAMVSRGCPYQCTFCEETCSKALYSGGYFRRKSVETVMGELVEGKARYNFREVIFKDSYLSGDTPWLEALMEAYRAEIGVPFKCFCTILSFDDDTARLLKEDGCYNVEFGLQTWNEELRNTVLRRRETNDQARAAFEACARHKLWYDVDHMFDLPGETVEDHADGALAYRGLKYLNRIKVHRLVYLPGAEIVGHAHEAGIVPDDVEARLAEGQESDFYGASGGTRKDPLVSGYAALYKMLFALPTWLVRWLVRGRRARWLRFVPSLLMAPLQGVLALRSGDRRFMEYVRFYPRKIWRALVDAWRR